jgi:hypothetical protein
VVLEVTIKRGRQVLKLLGCLWVAEGGGTATEPKPPIDHIRGRATHRGLAGPVELSRGVHAEVVALRSQRHDQRVDVFNLDGELAQYTPEVRGC